MNTFLSELYNVIQSLLDEPSSPLWVAILVFLALVAAALVVRFTGEIFGCKVVTHMRVVITLAAMTGLLLTTAAATRLWIRQHTENPDFVRWMPLAAAVMVFLVIVIPVTCHTLRAGYFAAFLTLGLSLAAAAAIVTVSHAAGRACRAGTQSLRDSGVRILERERLKDAIR